MKSKLKYKIIHLCKLITKKTRIKKNTIIFKNTKNYYILIHHIILHTNILIPLEQIF